MKFSVNVIISALFLITSVCWGERHKGLKVRGDYSNLRVVVEEIKTNDLGLTKQLVETTLKRCFSEHGVTPIFAYNKEETPHHLKVRLILQKYEMADIYGFSLNIKLEKLALFYDLEEDIVGEYFIPSQGDTFAVGHINQRWLVLEIVEMVAGKFLIDYLDSN